MLNYGGVVIHMQPDFNELGFLMPRDSNFEKIQDISPLDPYSNQIIEFLDVLSKILLGNPESQMYPDVITFAFWIRKGNISKYKKKFLYKHSGEFRLGRGVVFHIASTNLPINFAYSLVVGLLSGNANIVKVSSKDFQQVVILSTALEKLLKSDEWKDLHDFITLLRYDNSKKTWTDFLSSLCDIRIIWGGNQTIEEIRKSPIQARSFDVCFGDRYSLCVICADKLVEDKNIEAIARGFYNDTYLFDQNAFTAPHLIIWLGLTENIDKAKDLFWGAVSFIAEKKYQLAPVNAVNKLVTFCRVAIKNEGVRREPSSTNIIVRIHLEMLPKDMTEYKSVGGYFNEFNAASLQEIVPIVTRKFQTLSYYGFEKSELQSFIVEQRLVGVDRCVAIGSTLDFEPVWDGKNLITTLSRIIN